MNDYSDLIVMMGAIVLFMMLSLQVNRFIIGNSMTNTQSEVEYYALIVAQEVVEDIRVLTEESQMQLVLADYPKTIDFHPFRDSEDTIPFDVQVTDEELHLAHASFADSPSMNSYHITVTVSSDYLMEASATGSVTLTTAKSFLVL